MSQLACPYCNYGFPDYGSGDRKVTCKYCDNEFRVRVYIEQKEEALTTDRKFIIRARIKCLKYRNNDFYGKIHIRKNNEEIKKLKEELTLLEALT